MSPIAPSRSSSLVVPSSSTVTLRPSPLPAHASKAGANFAFVTT